MTDFDRCLAFVWAREGVTAANPTGYSNTPGDPGGPTAFGIAQKSHPTLDIKALTAAQAKVIYAAEYWRASGADALQWPLNLLVFDCAVNQGAKTAQEILSISGPLPDVYLALRAGRYWITTQDRPASRAFLAGWLNRLALLRQAIKP